MNETEYLLRSTISKLDSIGLKLPTEPSVMALDLGLFLLRCLFAIGPYVLPNDTVQSPMFEIASKILITMPLYCSFPQTGLKPSLLQSEVMPDIIEEP
jgi:hypothetical protein